MSDERDKVTPLPSPRKAEGNLSLRAWRELLPAVTVLHGDCRELLPRLPEGCVDLVITDPPYNVGYQSNRRQNGKKLPKIHNDDLTEAEWRLLMGDAQSECFRVLRNDGHAYVFCNAQDRGMMCDAWTYTGRFLWGRDLAYVKGRGTGDRTGGNFVGAWEKILWLTKHPLGRLDPIAHRDKGGHDVRRLSGNPSDAMWVGRTVKTQQMYPAQKDLLALELLMNYSSQPGEVVLDCFAGVGSLGAANLLLPEEQQRKVMLMESNAEAVELCVKRLSALGKI